MTPEERRFLRGVYQRAERIRLRRAKMAALLTGACIAVVIMLMGKNMLTMLLAAQAALILLCACEWLRLRVE